MVLKWLAGQLRHPHGLFGEEVVGRTLNRVNRRVIDLSVGELELRVGQRVLDVGFGGGYELEALCSRVLPGEIVGIDASQDVVARARRRFRSHVSEGHLDLRVGDVISLPFPDETFDRALACNTLYFWDDPITALREIRRVLAPEARLAISLRTRAKLAALPFTRHSYNLYEPDEVGRMALRAGFTRVDVRHIDQDRWLDCAVVIAQR